MTIETGQSPVTELLARSRAGDARARDAAYAAVYDELKHVAHKQLRGNRRQAFQTTALVHEAWLKLSVNAQLAPADRNHLMALTTQAMRHVLVDQARRVHSQKRGSGLADVTLAVDNLAQPQAEIEVLALHELLEDLQAFDPRAAQIVELRYFGGYEETEIAELLDISESTVRRDWRRARA
ncbi:MAG: ECF-type sigma factor [Pseudoxanthomonas sp.]